MCWECRQEQRQWSCRATSLLMLDAHRLPPVCTFIYIFSHIANQSCQSVSICINFQFCWASIYVIFICVITNNSNLRKNVFLACTNEMLVVCFADSKTVMAIVGTSNNSVLLLLVFGNVLLNMTYLGNTFFMKPSAVNTSEPSMT